ncbi:MAG: hypothetical protein IPK35_10405 [Saprospiraceae bacterium]|nr:hypothetical protein [Saprospiraceae bacterium]
MNVNHYTPVQLSKKSFHLSQFFAAHFEPFLMTMIVLTGIIGSIYLFGHNFVNGANGNNNPKNDPSSPASIAAIILGDEDDSSSKANDFDRLVKIPGSVKSGEDFFFDFIGDEKASRYVMEMGDGVRLIVTQKNLMYNYAVPGKYTIELKEHKSGLLTLVGTKKIKVK